MAQRLISQRLLLTKQQVAAALLRRTITTNLPFQFPNTHSVKITTTNRWYHASPFVLEEQKPQLETDSTTANSDENTPPVVLVEATDAPPVDDDYVARHKAGLSDPSIPFYENPLHHVEDESKVKIFKDEFGPDEVMPEVPLPPIETSPDDICAPPHLHDLAEEIVNLTMLEMTELINKLQAHFGIEDSDIGMGGGGGGGAKQEEEVVKVEEKTSFDLKLTGFDARSKIKVIKEVRAITGLGLKEAKDLVEGAPKVVQKGIKMEEAEKFKAVLEAAGATIEIV